MAGRRSLKFALFPLDGRRRRRVRSSRGGSSGSAWRTPGRSSSTRPAGSPGRSDVDAPDLPAAAGWLIDWLDGHVGWAAIAGIAHRVVHGGPKYVGPETITEDVLGELRRISPMDPDHLPGEIAVIERFRDRLPEMPQVACFDTAFHHDLPRVARIVPIPRRFEASGVRRYGFHGLSYAYLMEALAPGRRARGRLRPGDPGPPGQRGQPGRRPSGEARRHDHGPDARRRPGHGHADGRHRPSKTNRARRQQGKAVLLGEPHGVVVVHEEHEVGNTAPDGPVIFQFDDGSMLTRRNKPVATGHDGNVKAALFTCRSERSTMCPSRSVKASASRGTKSCRVQASTTALRCGPESIAVPLMYATGRASMTDAVPLGVERKGKANQDNGSGAIAIPL